MLAPADLWRRAAGRIRERDPENDALRRAARAAIVLPIAAAVGFAVGGGSQTPMFAIFGSVALLVIVDFPGNRPARALAYGGLGVNGFVLITIGSLVAPIPWLAVTTMFVLAVAVTFSGVLSEIVAAGQRSTLLTFVLPACTPVGPIPERLLGWAIALALAIPAAMFLFPPRHHDDLRRHATGLWSEMVSWVRDVFVSNVTLPIRRTRSRGTESCARKRFSPPTTAVDGQRGLFSSVSHWSPA